YRQLDADDLSERGLADLYGAALSHWQYLRRFTPGAPKVRVYNPTLAEHGWQLSHTVVEIVNDDMPFLVDSVTMEVNRQGLTLHLIVHPIIAVRRTADGTLIDIAREGDAGALLESFIHMEVDRIVEPARLEALSADIARVLKDVRVAVGDWRAMRERLSNVIADVEQRPPPLPADDLAEGTAFLRWLSDNHFTFLGYRCADLVNVDGEETLRIVP